MSSQFLGCRAVIARSFARIHETNLKKQGVLALTFAKAADYEKIKGDDRVNLRGLKNCSPGQPLTLVIKHKDGSEESCALNHSFNEEQIKWFKAGSALNLLRKQ